MNEQALAQVNAERIAKLERRLAAVEELLTKPAETPAQKAEPERKRKAS